MKVIKDKDQILFTDKIVDELGMMYSKREICEFLNILSLMNITKRVEINKEQKERAEMIAKQREVPDTDALYAILAKDNKAILVTRDRHFDKLRDIVEVKKPEEIV